MQFETERFLLREFTLEDAEQMYRLNLDPKVLQFTGDQPFESVVAATEFLKNYNHYQLYGFGRWAVIRKSDQVWLGWCGLKYTARTNEHDIGFRFFQQYWGQGYATEAAKKCLEIGQTQFNMPLIVGRAMKANTGSIKVLKKIGMQWWKDIDFEGKEGVVYKTKNLVQK